MKIPALLLTCLLATSALAIGTSHWSHTSEADFKAGTFHNVVATNLGDLKLSRAVKTILGQNEHVSAVHAMVEAADGTIYAGTGPEGVLLSIKNDKAETIATLGENLSIFSLLIDAKGRLLIGTGGDKGKILIQKSDAKAGEKPVEFFSEDGVQYIWSMCQTPDGKIYAATGPEGQLFQIDEDGKHEVVLDSEQNNLTSLVSDGKDLLYVGSDPDGLIYRVNRQTKDVFVMFDAPESEISALVLGKDGTLYAGTAAETEEAADASEAGATEQVGRPEGDTGGVPLPTQPPEAPKPPQPTPPSPGEPAPIPKADAAKPPAAPLTEPKHLLILVDDPAPSPDPADPPAAAAAANKKPASTAAAAQNLAAKTAPPATPAAAGNAIYRLDKDGFVNEIFRQPVIVHSLIEQNGLLLVGTGSEGMIYQVNPAAEETIILAKVDPKEVVSLLAMKDGRVMMGLANSGDIAVMTSGFAIEGTYTSAVLDATQISRFGKMQLHGTLPADTKLTVATRSANVGENTGQGWSDWTAEQSATEFMPIESPTARYLQYRLTFTSAAGKDTPVVDDVAVAYQMPNLAPQIKSVKIASKTADAAEATAPAANKAPADHHLQTITWEATDPNGDAMQYSVFFRSGAHGQWIELKDKLAELTWDWDTRSVADGRYEVKVVASDAAANPRTLGKITSRVSDPLVVDNTAPIVGDLKAVAKGASAHVELRVVDRDSTVASMDYAIDSSTDWQSVLPSDNIADSPDEAYSFDSQPLTAGAHQITVRATDAFGNQAHESVTITVAAPTALR